MADETRSAEPIGCSECKREPREDENPDDEWRAPPRRRVSLEQGTLNAAKQAPPAAPGSGSAGRHPPRPNLVSGTHYLPSLDRPTRTSG